MNEVVMEKETLDGAKNKNFSMEDANKMMKFFLVSPDKIIRSEENDFKVESDISAFAESIRAVGLSEPLNTRPLEDGTFKLISGERRFTAIQYGNAQGWDWIFQKYIPCFYSETGSMTKGKETTSLDDKILIYESNIRSRDLHSSYLELIKTLYYLYEDKQRRDGTYPEGVIKHLANELGIGFRQTRKLVSIARNADFWISEAVSDHKLSTDKAAVISGLDPDKQAELKAYFEEHGKIPDEVLDRYRKSNTWIQDALNEGKITEKEAELINNLDGNKKLSVKKYFEKNDKIPDEIFSEYDAPADENRTEGQLLNKGDESSENKGNDIFSVPKPTSTPDYMIPPSARVQHNNPIPMVSHPSNMEVIPDDIDLADYEDPTEFETNEDDFFGFASDEVDYDAEGFREPSFVDKNYAIDKTVRGESNKNSEESTHTLPSIDMDKKDEIMSNALYWFLEIKKRGFITLQEMTMIDSMVMLLAEFYFPRFVNQGYIDEKMQSYVRKIVEEMTPLLEK